MIGNNLFALPFLRVLHIRILRRRSSSVIVAPLRSVGNATATSLDASRGFSPFNSSKRQQSALAVLATFRARCSPRGREMNVNVITLITYIPYTCNNM